MSENKMDYLKATNIHETDLHIHTHYSDGQSDPASIVKKAKELGYAVIAITDHDGTGGLREAVEAGIREKIKVVPGIELAVETEKGIGLHILGYDIDMENPGLRKVLLDLESRRQRRNEKLLSVLAEKGYLLSQDELKRIQPEGFIGKPVIARALAQKGYVKDYREAFEEGKFLECKEAKAVKKEKIRADEAISLIHAAGGTAVLAHPIQTKKIGKPASEEFYRNIEAIIVKLKTEGLKGLECYHPDQNYEQTRRFIELAEKHNLYITRGSDFHGSDYGDAKPTA